MKQFIYIVCLLFFSLTSLQAKDNWVEGYVYIHKQKKERQPAKRLPLKNIPVSNGDTIVMTDSKGKYKIPITCNESVFPILPGDYEFVTGSIPSTNSLSVDSSIYVQSPINQNFTVKRNKSFTNFRMAAVVVIQV